MQFQHNVVTSQRLTLCSILSTLYITPRSDNVLIDVAIWSNGIRSVAILSHITITEDKFPPSTSDVVHFHTVGNVWFDICQVQGKWRIPTESRTFLSEPFNAIQGTLWLHTGMQSSSKFNGRRNF